MNYLPDSRLVDNYVCDQLGGSGRGTGRRRRGEDELIGVNQSKIEWLVVKWLIVIISCPLPS